MRGAAHALWENAVLTAHRAGLVRNALVDRRRAAILRGALSSASGKRRMDRKRARKASPAQPAEIHRRARAHPGAEGSSRVPATWGVDVGAAAFIRQTLVDLSRAGAAVLVVSEELDELFEICDRLLVISNGRVSPPLIRKQTNREADRPS